MNGKECELPCGEVLEATHGEHAMWEISVMGLKSRNVYDKVTIAVTRKNVEAICAFLHELLEMVEEMDG